MQFGISLPTDPPTEVQVEKAKLAESCGFTHVWCWDTHILMQEYSPQMTMIALETHAAVIGSCVTNPVTRDPTVVASFFATLANMVGGDRLVCGIGRGDSAVRIRRVKPSSLTDLEKSVRIIQGLTGGSEVEVDGHPVRLEWARGGEDQGNHIADILRHHDRDAIPDELRAYVDERGHYDYRQHTRQGAEHSAYVPDEIIDRFTILGPVDDCVGKLRELEALGVTEFNMYTTIPDPEQTIATYGNEVIPLFAQSEGIIVGR
jgi:alkanesulfonate monooxygenase SsuD/methylene tetrahydromethanopterin reductase-like flavin-dependent oxidoreductase (luciferase family)